MKLLIFLSSILFLSSIQAQHEVPSVQVKDHLYVFSFSGVNVRKEANINSPVLKKLPHGKKVDILAVSLFEDEFDNRKSNWYKIAVNGKEGYIFGGFLSTNEPPFYDHYDFSCADDTYFKSWITNLSLHTSITKEGYEVIINDERPELCEEIHTSTFDSGEVLEERQSLGSHYFSFSSNELNYNDILNFLDYMAACRSKHCGSESGFEKSLIIPIKDDQGKIQSIRCNVPHQIKAEKVMGKLVVELNMNT